MIDLITVLLSAALKNGAAPKSPAFNKRHGELLR